jgi:hypothetical protein
VLTAYVRQHSPWPPRDPAHDGIDYIGTEGLREPPLRDDIQAVLSVIGRRQKGRARRWEQQLDLARTDLRGYDLSQADLSGATLGKTHLEGAVLTWANLERTFLYDTHLQGASLFKTRFADAVILWADFTQATSLTAAQIAAAQWGPGAKFPPDVLAELDAPTADVVLTEPPPPAPDAPPGSG